LVPWGARGLYEAPAIEHKACPPTMGGEPPRAIQLKNIFKALPARQVNSFHFREG